MFCICHFYLDFYGTFVTEKKIEMYVAKFILINYNCGQIFSNGFSKLRLLGEKKPHSFFS